MGCIGIRTWIIPDPQHCMMMVLSHPVCCWYREEEKQRHYQVLQGGELSSLSFESSHFNNQVITPLPPPGFSRLFSENGTGTALYLRACPWTKFILCRGVASRRCISAAKNFIRAEFIFTEN